MIRATSAKNLKEKLILNSPSNNLNSHQNGNHRSIEK